MSDYAKAVEAYIENGRRRAAELEKEIEHKRRRLMEFEAQEARRDRNHR